MDANSKEKIVRTRFLVQHSYIGVSHLYNICTYQTIMAKVRARICTDHKYLHRHDSSSDWRSDSRGNFEMDGSKLPTIICTPLYPTGLGGFTVLTFTTYSRFSSNIVPCKTFRYEPHLLEFL